MLTNFPNGLSSFGVPVLPGIPIPFTGNYFFVDPASGADGNDGNSELPLATLGEAYSRCTSGNNDVVLLVGNGQASGSARLSATLTWAKDATHLIGITAPTQSGFQRARIAVTSGASVFTPLVDVQGDGCFFSNFSTFYGFNNASAQICWFDEGERNYYGNVGFGGMGDATAAAQAGSRSLKIGASGRGEHTFYKCTIGLDTVTRSAANASLELAGATPRNTFIECIFPAMTSAAGALFVLGTGNGCIDRWTMFKSCDFLNAVKSTSTTMTVGFSFSTGSPGGMIVLDQSTIVGATDWGDANFFSNAFLNMSAPSQSAGGIAVVPT